MKYFTLITLNIITLAASIATKSNFFFSTAIILPFTFFLFNKKGSPFIFSILVFVSFNYSYLLFVDYMIKPWFKVDPRNCDGPCFGWYMFEKTTPPDLYLNNAILILSLVSVLFINSKVRKK